MSNKKIILTGDRPTGKLHIGQYVGSLQNRVKLQNSGDYESYIMIADQQALTDNARDPEKIRNSLIQVALDYLAVGIDPKKSTILVQSQIPALSELTMHHLNLVTVFAFGTQPYGKKLSRKTLAKVCQLVLYLSGQPSSRYYCFQSYYGASRRRSRTNVGTNP